MHTEVGPYRVTAPIPPPGRTEVDVEARFARPSGLYVAEGAQGPVVLEVLDAFVGAGADPVTFGPAADTLVALEHPTLCTPRSWGFDERNRVRYLESPIASGAPFAAIRQAAQRPLTPVEAARVLLPLAEGLAIAHASRVVHGSIHPDRVAWRSPPGDPHAWHPVLTGFRIGPARTTSAFTAPEVDESGEDGRRSARHSSEDVYAVCALAWALAGVRAGADPRELCLLTDDERSGLEPIATDGRNPVWNDLLRHGLHPSRAQRLPSMSALARGLRGIVSTRPSSRSFSLFTQLERHLAKHRAATNATPISTVPRAIAHPAASDVRSGPVGLPAPKLLPRPPKKPSVPPKEIFTRNDVDGPARPRDARQMFAALLGLRMDQDGPPEDGPPEDESGA